MEYHCNGQGAGALALQGEGEGTGFIRPKEKKAKWDLTAALHYIKAAKTEPVSPQSCIEENEATGTSCNKGNSNRTEGKSLPQQWCCTGTGAQRGCQTSIAGDTENFPLSCLISFGVSHATNPLLGSRLLEGLSNPQNPAFP